MKKITLVSFALTIVTACTQLSPKNIAEEIRQHRAEQHELFANPKTSPLMKEDLEIFEGLDYFDIDTAFYVRTHLLRTPDEKPFFMPTTTDRRPEYRKYGEIHFTLRGGNFKLNIYQNLNLADDPEYEDYLFLPFTDRTNGETTYGGGRYLDLSIPEGDEMVVDFNKAYNPLCVYDYRFSCPIPPEENDLDIAITAGVKDFKPVRE